jgi:uncharacterized protein YggT (Ycf19 family)
MRSEFVDTQGNVHRESLAPSPILGRIAQVVDYLFSVLYVLLLVRFALEFFDARRSTGFFELIRETTDIFYAPFKGIFAVTVIDNRYFVWPLVVCILGYMVLHALIRGLLHLLARD